jgi:hypothetical protein
VAQRKCQSVPKQTPNPGMKALLRASLDFSTDNAVFRRFIHEMTKRAHTQVNLICPVLVINILKEFAPYSRVETTEVSDLAKFKNHY